MMKKTKIISKFDKFKEYFIKTPKVFNITIPEVDDDDEWGEERLSHGNIIIRINAEYISSRFECSEISCGVYTFVSLPYNSQIINVKSLLKEEHKEEFFTLLYDEIFKDLKEKEKVAWMIASTNSDFTEISKVFDKLAVNKTRWKTNPNSGNKIKTWIL